MAMKFKEEEIGILRQILYGTWEYIANDIMDALAAEGRNSIKQADVVEVVLDADHCQRMVQQLKAQEVWKMFDSMPYKDRIAFAKKNVFTAKVYA